MRQLLYATFLITMSLSSCTIVKRIDTGYSINWHRNQYNNYQKHSKDVAIKFKASDVKADNETASASSEIKEEVSPEIIIASTVNTIALLEKNERIVANKIISSTVIKKAESVTSNVILKKANPTSAAWLWRIFKKKSKTPLAILILLCFIFPPLAVGLATKFKPGPVILSFVLTMLLVIPGVIHALIVSIKSSKNNGSRRR